MTKEKKYIIYGIVAIMIVVIGTTLAYFAAKIVGDTKPISVTTANLRIIFNNGDGTITGTDLEPGGYDETKTFSIQNDSDREYKYNIIIKDLVNTFVTEGYLVYKITNTSNNGGYSMTDFKDIPKSSSARDAVLAYSISIPAGVTQEYSIQIKYLNDADANQSEDMEKEVTGKLFITEGTEGPTPFMTAILRDNPTISERTDFSVTNTATTTGTIYQTNKTEDGSTVYYYSGNTTNNWVKFGKYMSNGQVVGYKETADKASYKIYNTLDQCASATTYNVNCSYLWKSGDDIYWRIIRTNEDGSIRMLYSGASPDTSVGHIGVSSFNSIDNDPLYVGYMYGTSGSLANNRTNTNSSTIKTAIDTWYQNNLLTIYDKYISKSAIYCNDRSVGNGTYNTGSTSFYYGTSERLGTYKPSYKCGANTSNGLFESTQAVEDKFSASTAGGGNGQLKYPIALMTADEVAFAGAVWIKFLSSPYAWYYTNSQGESITGGKLWWTLSPYSWYPWDDTYADAGVMDVGGDPYSKTGNIGGDARLLANDWVRPAISLSSCVKVFGTGTPDDPYEIEYDNSCN